MEVWLHSEYRQFRHLRQPGDVITVRDGVGAGLVAKGAACPVINGEHQCQKTSDPSTSAIGGLAGTDNYLDEQMDTPAHGMMLPVKWSRQKRRKLQEVAHRSRAMRALIKGKRFENIPRSVW